MCFAQIKFALDAPPRLIRQFAVAKEVVDPSSLSVEFSNELGGDDKSMRLALIQLRVAKIEKAFIGPCDKTLG